MAQATDVEIAGAGYMLLPGGYKRSAEPGLPTKSDRLNLDTFAAGQLVEQGTGDSRQGAGGGWGGLTVHAVLGGAGLEPWPNAALEEDANLLANPSLAVRTPALIAGNNAYFAIGATLYKTVALSAGSWADVTAATTVSATITDLAYFQDDVLILQGAGNDIRRYNTSSGATSAWRAGEQGTVGIGYGAALFYAKLAANNQERVDIGLTRSDGQAVTRERFLDAPVVRMGLFAGKMVIATKTSLYQWGGVHERGPISNPTNADVLWIGDPAPLFTHGQWVDTDSGDFGFLLALGGRLYTWLAGGVVEYDPSLGREGWRPVGPRGQASYGACVAGPYLIVALVTIGGESQVWAFDGAGWWLIHESTGGSERVWPLAVGGAGDYDALALRAGSTTYDLYRLLGRSVSVHSYAAAGTWVSSLLHAGHPDRPKAWRKVGAVFASPELPGNPGSLDQVTITLEYSTNGGASWTLSDTATIGIGQTTTLEAEISPPPQSRFLQLRLSWSSVLDWAPILTQAWADYALLDNGPRRRRWEIKVAARDAQVKREGGVQSTTGRQQIAALWAAWATGAPVSLRDTDYDSDPTERTVRVLSISEEAPKPSDQGRWGDAVVALVLAEV
ncbi:MAG: hypothetical protein ACRDJN_11830 [Chloroflexota bacterium]